MKPIKTPGSGMAIKVSKGGAGRWPEFPYYGKGAGVHLKRWPKPLRPDNYPDYEKSGGFI